MVDIYMPFSSEDRAALKEVLPPEFSDMLDIPRINSGMSTHTCIPGAPVRAGIDGVIVAAFILPGQIDRQNYNPIVVIEGPNGLMFEYSHVGESLGVDTRVQACEPFAIHDRNFSARGFGHMHLRAYRDNSDGQVLVETHLVD